MPQKAYACGVAMQGIRHAFFLHTPLPCPKWRRRFSLSNGNTKIEVDTKMIQAPENVAMPPKEAEKTASGIAKIVLKANPAGETLVPSDWVMLHYTGWTTDGKMFDSTKVSGKPAVFPLEQLIPGMSEAITLAKVGESLRVWIPEALAYKGMPDMPQGMLVFDFDILQRVTPEMPPENPSAEAIHLHDGLAYQILKSEDGAPISEKDVVTLDFIGWTVGDKKRFHSSLEAGEPLVANVAQLFHGFRDVLVHAHKGDILVIWMDQKYGIDPNGRELKGNLVFSMQIIDVEPMPAALEAPSDVAAPPSDAEKTASGLASKVLEKGSGTVHPKATDTVRVHYTGWTTDGEMFDSSVVRGEPSQFPLNRVIAGWTEGLQLMVEGEKRRFWIPENLAYKGMRGAPAGMLVFDVELIAIV